MVMCLPSSTFEKLTYKKYEMMSQVNKLAPRTFEFFYITFVFLTLCKCHLKPTSRCRRSKGKVVECSRTRRETLADRTGGWRELSGISEAATASTRIKEKQIVAQ